MISEGRGREADGRVDVHGGGLGEGERRFVQEAWMVGVSGRGEWA